MMPLQEIVCHGKRLDNGEWVEGYFVRADGPINNGKCYILPTVADFSYGDNGNRIRIGCFVEVDPESVGRYTGLRDKNGKKIFEKDIVAYEDEAPGQVEYHDSTTINRGEVAFGDGTFYFTNAVAARIEDLLYGDGTVECEVIGNTTDNPELLKECA